MVTRLVFAWSGRLVGLLAGALWVAGCGASDDAHGAPDADVGGDDDDDVPANGCVASVGVGAGFVCVLRDDGQVWCWGDNTSGQLGVSPSAAPRITPGPVQVAPDTPLGGVAELSVGGGHACARRADGTVPCWGASSSGQLGRVGGAAPGDAVEDDVPISDAQGVAAGVSFTCILRSGGRVSCVGLNNTAQLGTGTEGDVDGFVTVLREDSGAPLEGIETLSAAGFHACGTGEEGVVCWGRSDNGQLGDGLAPARPRAAVVAALADLSTNAVRGLFTGFQSTCVVRDGGEVECWGEMEDFVFDSTQVFFRTVSPMVIESFPPARAISGGNDGEHLCAISVDGGDLYCLGRNHVGQLGVGTTVGEPMARRVELENGTRLGPVVSVVENQLNTCAVHADRTVWCWGSNASGQLALPPGEARARPVRIDVPCPDS